MYLSARARSWWIVPGVVEGLNPRKDDHHAAPRKYPEELKERAVRLCLDAEGPRAGQGLPRRIGEELDINGETLRGWVRQAQIDDHQLPGTTTDGAQRIGELEKKVRELRRANEILRQASASFAQAVLDRL